MGERMRDLKNFYKCLEDSSDKYSSCVGFHFEICQYMYENDYNIPKEWEYGHGLGFGGQDEIYLELFQASTEIDLIKMGNLLSRYAQALKYKKGEDL